MVGHQQRQRSITGWGYTDARCTDEEVAGIGQLLAQRFGVPPRPRRPVPADQVPLPTARISPPGALADLCSTDHDDRCLHAVGRSFADVVRAFSGQFAPAPDIVARPRDAGDVARLLDWCSDAGADCVPFGGGTSVVGGVNPPPDRPVVTMQMREMGRVLDVDPVSRAARIEAGAVGPSLEDQLRAHELTLRFFPQSFELSTLGGWIATRAGGHYATRLTHIDDLVESITAITPAGEYRSRRLPGSGAGPSPDRLLLGSEGALGVITEAWVRLQQRPRWKVSASVRFGSFAEGVAGLRALVQSGLDPANCRLLDETEAALFAGADGQHAVLVLGLESAHHPLEADARIAMELLADHGGRCPEGPRMAADVTAGTGEDLAGTWRSSFLRVPYLRDGMVALGMITETFETAVPWSGFADLHARVMEATRKAVDEVCGGGVVTCRVTHAYPDGAAPYFTVIGPGRHGSQVEQWWEIKRAASDALLAAGGTITHHHAVGRDHRPWYDQQRPDLFAGALGAVKRTLDPAGVMNPGVLLD